MSNPRIVLSIEELAYALGVIGGEDVASGFLLSVLGERPKEELEARLLSASHSLIARRILTLDLETMTKTIKPDVHTLLSPLLVNRFSLRCSRTQNGIETIVNYYFGDVIISYRTLNPVIAEIGQMNSVNDILSDIASFYVLPHINAPSDQSAMEVPAPLIEALKNNANQLAQEQMMVQLQAAGVEEQLATALLEDLITDELRGSIIRIEQHDAALISNEGFLILKSPKRFWLFQILASDLPKLQIWQGNHERFAECFSELLH